MDEDLLADLDDLGDEESSTDSVESGHELSEEIPDSLAANTKTFNSKALLQNLSKIDEFLSRERNSFHNSGPVEQDQEYQTIVSSNTLNVELLHEISNVGKVISQLTIDAQRFIQTKIRRAGIIDLEPYRFRKSRASHQK